MIDFVSETFFISAFTCHANRVSSFLNRLLVIQTPLGKEIVRSEEFKGCPSRVDAIEP